MGAHGAHTGSHCAQHPPMHASTVAAGKPPQSCGSHIHDPVAKLKEELPLQRLREEVGLVVQSVNVRHDNLTVFDALAHEEVTPCDVLGLLVMLGIVGNIPTVLSTPNQ